MMRAKFLRTLLGLELGLQITVGSTGLAQLPAASEEAFRSSLSPEWPTVKVGGTPVGLVVRELSRPYPDGTGTFVSLPASDMPAAERIAVSSASAYISQHVGQIVTPLTRTTNLTDSLAVREVMATVNRSEYKRRGTDFTVVYAQRHLGLPVFDGSLRVSMTQDGVIWSLINKLEFVETPPVQPTLSSEQAVRAAMDAMGTDDAAPDGQPSLCIYPPSSLVWHITFAAPQFTEFLIDASSGVVALRRNTIRD